MKKSKKKAVKGKGKGKGRGKGREEEKTRGKKNKEQTSKTEVGSRKKRRHKIEPFHFCVYPEDVLLYFITL